MKAAAIESPLLT